MIYFVLKYIRFNCIKHMYRAQLFRIPPIIIAMQTFPAVYCVVYYCIYCTWQEWERARQCRGRRWQRRRRWGTCRAWRGWRWARRVSRAPCSRGWPPHWRWPARPAGRFHCSTAPDQTEPGLYTVRRSGGVLVVISAKSYKVISTAPLTMANL